MPRIYTAARSTHSDGSRLNVTESPTFGFVAVTGGDKTNPFAALVGHTMTCRRKFRTLTSHAHTDINSVPVR
jgi:hypothetical protein